MPRRRAAKARRLSPAGSDASLPPDRTFDELEAAWTGAGDGTLSPEAGEAVADYSTPSTAAFSAPWLCEDSEPRAGNRLATAVYDMLRQGHWQCSPEQAALRLQSGCVLSKRRIVADLTEALLNASGPVIEDEMAWYEVRKVICAID